ncbi:S-adenosylmethionine transporter [Vararia minispora EC-137]|uniref:S-adenosylmethionine transporter n=1 Tax=Vararia minispora EC-137 TaxID=1314806 RepID=A0ACB8QPZ0_9AGAM|nr:S-adenosylmethionine transporter [Vararia minispora EC-137]
MASTSGPSFAQSLVAGGLAGTSVDLLFYPIDSIKTRLQSSQGFVKAGGLKGVYKGVGSVVVGSSPGAAVFFSIYDTLKREIAVPAHLEPIKHMLAASAGEVGACLIRVPTEVVKTRSQTSSYGTAATSSLSAARLLWKTEGLSGFYRGFGVTVMREIPFTSLQFPLYELFKRRLSLALYDGPGKLHAYQAAVCGSVAGGIAAAATTPLDVLKTRIMLDMRSPTHAAYPSLWARARDIYLKEGVGALFAGVVPRTLWISAGGAVFLGVYEWTIGVIRGTKA